MTRSNRPSLAEVLLPAGPVITPFNILSALILLGGAAIVVYRFVNGLGAATNLSDTNPWGLWISVKLCLVAMAGGGFCITTAVYLFGMNEYKPIARPAVLGALVFYSLFIISLILDLGRPLRLPFPFVVQAGPTSFLFEIALCVALYLTTLFVEFTPAVFEWLGWKLWRKVVVGMTLSLTIFGLLLSTLHQSSLGALYLLSPTKLHPLWYSSYIPLYFFVSSMAAGISFIIVESMLSHRIFSAKSGLTRSGLDDITVGLAKAGAIVLAVYFGIKVMGVTTGGHWDLLWTPMGHWFLFELLGFVLLPCMLFTIGFRERSAGLIRFTAILVIAGIVLNRFNVSWIAFNWQLPSEERYVPHWMEIWTSLSLIVAGVVVFRWVANRMPILHEHPDYPVTH